MADLPHPIPLKSICAEHDHPLLFATVSGAHLYGFESPDSDVDLRGAHIHPTRELLGLEAIRETLDRTEIVDGVEIDLVTHEVGKFFRLLLRPNGYVLEQLMSPLVVEASEPMYELRDLLPKLVTRNHVHHYRGFANTEWALFLKGEPKRIKPLLYVYRVLLTGTHLMRTREVVAHLPTLAEEAGLTFLSELFERKRAGKEQSTLAVPDLAFHQAKFDRLMTEMLAASESSRLPETPSARSELNDMLVRIRVGAL